LLFSAAFLLITAIGALIIAVTDGDVWGHVICGTSVYLLVMLYFPTKRLFISIGYVVVLFGYAIFAIVYYHDHPRFVLQGLSMIIIIIFLFFAVNFVRKYMENKELMSKQIFIYSNTLFPTLRYMYSENKMTSSNTVRRSRP
jgi:hypothetical protein